MLDSSMTVPLHFTVEFLGFLVAAGGALLVLSRPVLVPGTTSNRVSASLGLGAIATAQVLHGGAFFRADGAELLVGLQTLGLALILVGLVGAMRAPAAAALLPSREPVLLAPVAAGVLLGILALASSRSGPRELRRLALSGILFAAAGWLTAYSPKLVVDMGRLDSAVAGAHLLKLLAFLTLGSWLWTAVRSSIRTRFVASFVALLVLVVLALSTALTGVLSGQVESNELQRIRNQLQNVVGNIANDETTDVLQQAKRIARISQVQNALAGGGDLGSFAREVVRLDEFFTVDVAIFIDRQGSNLSYFGRRPSESIVDGGPVKTRPMTQRQVVRFLGGTVVDSVRNLPAQVAASVDDIRDEAVAIVAASEVRAAGATVGYAILGRWIDAFTIDEISQTLDAPASLFVGGDLVVSTLPDRLVEGDLLTPQVRQMLRTGQPATVRQDLGRRSYFTAYIPLQDGAGDPVDATLALSQTAVIATQARAALTRILFLVAMGAAGIVMVLAYLSGRRITRPIQELTTTARVVREGDLSAQADVGGDDEVGQLGETFNEMTAALMRMTSDLREAAREEYRLRSRIETIIQSMADALVAVDADMNVLAFNPEAERLTAVRASDAIGRPVREVIDARDAQGQPAPIPIFRLAEGSVAGIFIARGDDETVPVAVTSAVLRGDEDEVAGGVAVIRDMSRERELERMKSEFLSNISHELRTPLTPIKGYAEILGRKEVPPEKARQFVRGILESTGRLERIVGLLVDFAALEAGRLSPRVSTIDVAALLDELASDWKKRSKRHDVVADVGADLPRVVGDERLLRRSLEEVLDNAVKFSPDGGTIRLHASSNGGRVKWVDIVVSDEGIGIPAQDLPKIFSDFHQLDGSETRAYGGLGLGLAFVQRIVEAHQGSVSVESEPDQGTRLTISIPSGRKASE